MTNSADPDPDLDLHCLQKQGISGFSRTRVKFLLNIPQDKVVFQQKSTGIFVAPVLAWAS